MPKAIVSNLRGLAGAAIGAVIGFFAFTWIYRQGLYAMIVPGALIGLGAELLALHRSKARGVACAVAALLLAIFAEWSVAPFVADDGLDYFLNHLHELRPITWIMIALGMYFAYRWGKETFHPGRPVDEPAR